MFLPNCLTIENLKNQLAKQGLPTDQQFITQLLKVPRVTSELQKFVFLKTKKSITSEKASKLLPYLRQASEYLREKREKSREREETGQSSSRPLLEKEFSLRPTPAYTHIPGVVAQNIEPGVYEVQQRVEFSQEDSKEPEPILATEDIISVSSEDFVSVKSNTPRRVMASTSAFLTSLKENCEATTQNELLEIEYVQENDEDSFILVMLGAVTTDVAKELSDLLAYQGFDPKAIRAVLRAYQPSNDKRAKDLVFLIAALLTRGSSIIDKLGKVKEESKQLLLKYKSIYHIKRKVTDSSVRTTVTLARIVNSYPEIAYKIMQSSEKLNRPVSVEMMRDTGFTDFPSSFRGSFIFGLMRKTDKADPEKYEGVLKGVLHHQVLESKILNTKTDKYKGLTNVAILRDVLVFAEAAYDNSPLKATERENYTVKITTNSSVSAIKIWIAKFNELYVDFTDINDRFN